MLRGNLQSAINEYTKCIQISPEYSPALLARAECFFQQASYQLAILDCTEFIKTYRKYYEIMDARRSDPVRCETVLSRAVWLRGSCYYKIGDERMAINDLTICAELGEKETPLAHHYLGKCYMKEGKWYESIVENTKAIELKPQLVGAFKDRATANSVVGREDDAKEDSRRFSMLMSKLSMEGRLPTDKE